MVDVGGIVNDHFLPEVAAVFYERQMQRMLLVSGLRFEVVEEHQLGYLPGRVDDLTLSGGRGFAYIEFFYTGNICQHFEASHQLVEVSGGAGIFEPKEYVVNYRRPMCGVVCHGLAICSKIVINEITFHMRKLPILYLLLFRLPCLAFAQTIQTSAEPDPSVDYGRLARIDTFIEGYVRRGWINGVVTLVVHNGRVVQYKGYGYADIGQRRPMHRDDLFRIASQTKAIVSVALMQLFEEGKFYLDEPVADFLPAYKDMRVLDKFKAEDTTYTTVPAKRPITFRDLLTHTSGLDYPVIGTKEMRAIYAKAGIPSGLGVFDYDLRERMEALAKLPLGHQPGEKWTYSLGVDLAGCLIEVISGKNLEEYLAERIFRPLGMNDTYFNVPASKADRLVRVYREDSLHRFVPYTFRDESIDPDYPLRQKRYFSGGAGLTSTAWDYAVFLQMMLNGGSYNGVHILAPRTVQLMTSGQLGFNFNGVDNFGLGFEITSAVSAAREVRNEGTFSWGGYYGTTYWADPKARLVCLVMTNERGISHWWMEKEVEDMIYASFVK